jgi:hypothetical protein
VQSTHATSRQEVSQEIGGFDPDRPQIPQPGLAGFFFNFSQTAQQAFDPDEVVSPMRRGALDQK